MARRTPTLPIASAGGVLPYFSITDAAWKQIEEACGALLSDDIRQAIVKATEHYIRSGAFEHEAEPLSTGRERIKRVEKATANLIRELMDDAAQASDAQIYADRCIRDNIQAAPLFIGGDPLRNFGDLLFSFRSACERALKVIDDTEVPSHRKWEYWGAWVDQLAEIAKKNNLPYGTQQRDSNDPSPFVALVNKIQGCLPKEYKRPIADGPYALAQAINRARQSRKELDETN